MNLIRVKWLYISYNVYYLTDAFIYERMSVPNIIDILIYLNLFVMFNVPYNIWNHGNQISHFSNIWLDMIFLNDWCNPNNL